MADAVEKKEKLLNRQKKIFDSMPGDLQKATRTICEKLSKPISDYLKLVWKIGEALDTIHENKDNQYGTEPLAKMEVVIGRERGYLYKAMHFYRDFSEDFLNEIVSRRMKQSNRPITWTHIVSIMSIEKEENRRRYVDLTFDNDWTPPELDAAMRKEFNKETKHAGGRPVKVPTTFSGKLTNIDKVLKIVVRNAKEIWANETNSIVSLAEAETKLQTPKEVANQIDIELILIAQAREALKKSEEILLEARSKAMKKVTGAIDAE